MSNLEVKFLLTISVWSSNPEKNDLMNSSAIEAPVNLSVSTTRRGEEDLDIISAMSLSAMAVSLTQRTTSAETPVGTPVAAA